jgi:outer membrane receptor protein involved in Fe transport
MKRETTFLFFILLFITPLIGWAQTPVKGITTIKGYLVEESSGNPIEYANVVLYTESDSQLVTGCISGHEGAFVLTEVAEGTYYLMVTFIGYQTFKVKSISVLKKQKMLDLGKLELKASAMDLDEVSIQADKSMVEYKVDKKVVNVSGNPSLVGGTAADALRDVPSVSVDIDGNVMLRGSGNFTVLIDGKPTVLSGNDLLKQIPVAAIEKIEVMTNPSAKYDPQGNTGIINIITKKDSDQGFSGLINLTLGTGQKATGSVSLNYKRKKTNYFLKLDMQRNRYRQQSELYRESYLSDTMNKLLQTTDRDMLSNRHSVKIGADYNHSAYSSFSVSGELGLIDFDRGFTTTYHQWYDPELIHTYFKSENDFNVYGWYYAANASHSYKFKKKKDASITSTLLYSSWMGNRDEFQHEFLTDKDYVIKSSSSEVRRLEEEVKNYLQIKSDFVWPVKKGKIEAGFQIAHRPVIAGIVKEDFNPVSSVWVYDSVFSNELTYYQDVFATYFLYTGELKGFQYQLGIRPEFTDRLMDQKTLNKKYPFRKMEFFPSFALTKSLKNNQQLQFSYSRRVNRPNEHHLNPFPDYADRYVTSLGNPALEPEYTNSFELNYVKRMKIGMIAVEAYYRQQNNAFQRYITQEDDGYLVVHFQNIERYTSAGIDLSANLALKKWWRLAGSVSAFNYQMEGDIVNVDLPENAFTFVGRANSIFTFSAKSRLQIYGSYNAPAWESQGIRKAFVSLGAAYRHEFFKRKLGVTLSINNPFGLFVYASEMNDPLFHSTFSMNNEANVITLGLSYKINNYKATRRTEDSAPVDVGSPGMF